jgi:hypothetical protein
MAGRHTSKALARRRRKVEDDEYAAMLLRMIHRYADRIAADPTAGVHLKELKAALANAGNVGFYAANRLADHPYGLNELADIAGISKQSMHEQIKRGEITHQALELARAEGRPIVRLADLRAARLAITEQKTAASNGDRLPGPERGKEDHDA